MEQTTARRGRLASLDLVALFTLLCILFSPVITVSSTKIANAAANNQLPSVNAASQGIKPHFSGTLVQSVEFTPTDYTSRGKFSSSVSLSGDGKTALIGAGGYNVLYPIAAYIYSNINGTWGLVKELTPSDASDSYYYTSVSLSSDGQTAFIGAFNVNYGSGAVYVYANNNGAWNQVAKLTASDGASGDDFGGSISLSSDAKTVLIGAEGKNSETGASYIFKLIDCINFSQSI